VFAKLDHVQMGGVSDAVDKDQLVFGPIQGSHPRIGLVPDAKIQQVSIDAGTNCADVVHVTPVHTHKVHRAIARTARSRTKRIVKEYAKLVPAHLA
jgi:hypothetical protein